MKSLLQILILTVLIGAFSWASAEKIVTDNYKVSVNDILDIKVLEHPELNTLAVVAFDGTISFPYIGILNVRGMTVLEIKDDITKKLSEGYIKYPIVSVSLARSGSNYMYVYGEAQGRGQIIYENDMTIIKGLSAAQGITLNGLYGKLIVRRKQKGETGIYKNLVEVNLNNGFIANKEVEDMLLQPGDVLIIESNKTFLTQGEVMNRGRFALEKNMTVERALLQAGGITPDGRYGKIVLKRKKEATVGPYILFAESYIADSFIKEREVSDIILHPDDILIVERNKTFSIQGEAFSRGRIVLEDGMTVINALAIAGGVTPNGLYGKIKLKRKMEGEPEIYKDIAESDLVDGYIDSKQVQNILIQPDDILIIERNKQFYVHGEVGVPGQVVLEKGMTVLRALSLAKGISSKGLYGKVMIRRMNSESGEYENIEINLKEIIDGNGNADILMQAEDMLIVEPNKTYFIYGELNRTGQFVLEDDLTVFKAITIAGGFTKWGKENKVQILRQNNNGIGYHIIDVNINNIIKGDTSADIKLEAGDTIVAFKGLF